MLQARAHVNHLANLSPTLFITVSSVEDPGGPLRNLHVRAKYRDNGKGFGKPCTSPPHKGVQTFVCVLFLPCASRRHVTREVSRNHAPLLLIKAFDFCVYIRIPFLVCSPCVLVFPCVPTCSTSRPTPQRGNKPLLGK